MAADDLIVGLRDTVFTPAVEGVLRLAENPPGRATRATLLQASEWYRRLDDDGREQVRFLVEEAARQALFGVFAVIDEVRAFDGQLRLVHTSSAGADTTYGGAGSDLHDEWQALVPPR
jgi:hypothetical protein